MEDTVSTSAYELEIVSRLSRRQSASGAASPSPSFAFTPVTPAELDTYAVDDDDTATLAETSTIEPTVSKAARRPSRGNRPGELFKPLTALSPAPKLPDTPPDTPEKGVVESATEFFGTTSYPPTPEETSDPYGSLSFSSDTENEAGATEEVETLALPPIDKGVQAWSFLVAATLIEAVIWGLPYSVGVLHEYWVSTLFGEEATAILTLASTLNTGLLFFSGAFLGP